MKKRIAVAVGGLFALILVGIGCGGSLSATELGNLALQDNACVVDASTKDAADQCRHAVHVPFCAAHPGAGDICLPDGGAK